METLLNEVYLMIRSKNIDAVGTLGRLLVVFGLCSATALAAPILTLSLDSLFLGGARGTAVTFTGTILNTSGVELFLNGAGGNLSSSELTLDLTSFFTLTPLSLLDGESYTGAIFAIAISGVALPGDYFGTFTIQGGEDSGTFDTIGSSEFQVGVSDVPEPTSGLLVGLGGLVLALRGFKIHSAARRARPPADRWQTTVLFTEGA